MELISLDIQLGKRQYKIKLAPEHEPRVRQLLETIQDSNARLREEFPRRDEQDYLAMILIDFITRSDLLENKSESEKALHLKIKELAQSLNL